MNEKKGKPQKTIKYLTYDEVQRIIDCENSIRNKTLFMALFNLGVRVSELINIEVKDINWNENTVHIRHSGAKGSRERIIVMPSRFANIFREYIKVLKITGRIFPITRHRVLQICRAAGKRANIEGSLHPHRFRHAHAVHLLHKTNNIQAVKESLGHSTIAITSQYYARVPGPTMKRLVDDAFNDPKKNEE